MAIDQKISELPVASGIGANDISVLINNGTNYQFAFTTLLQFINSNIITGANINFGTTLPQNTTGKNGDIFVNTSTAQFAQKTSGIWTVVYSLPIANTTTNSTVLYGLGAPNTTTGNNQDTYIDTNSGTFYKKANGQWNTVFSMQNGPAGPQGVKGDAGASGTNGKTILSGTINPSNQNTGTNGDFYINTSAYTLFGPKTNDNWGTGIPLVADISEKADVTYVDQQHTNEVTSRLNADNNLQAQIDYKVDKISGLGLSQENFTTQDKSKLSNLATVALTGAKADIGLGNVDNTSDTDKPVSSAQQAAIDGIKAQLIDNAPTDANTLNKLLAKIQALQTFINGDDVNLNSIKELADAIKANELTVMALTSGKINITDVYNALDYALGGKTLDARQGKVLYDLFVSLQSGKVDKVSGKQLSTEDYTTLDKNKLAAIAIGATVNATDAQLRDRSTHTGTQSADTIIDGVTNKTYSATEKIKLAGIASGATNVVKATVTEINTAADDGKFTTALALSASKYLDQSGSKLYAQTTGSANNYILTLNPAITAYTTGQSFNIMIHVTNTGSSTININGLGIKNLVKIPSAIEAGDLQAGVMYTIIYNGTSFIISQFFLQGASDVETQAGSNNTKVVTPVRLSSWWNYAKSQIATITARWAFSILKFTPSSNNSTPQDGDVWYNSNTFKAQVGIQLTSLLTQHSNTALSGSTNRVAQVNPNGDVSALNEIMEGFITDSDITNAITTATYNSGNSYSPTISPPNSKVFGQGLWYKSGPYLYFAVTDNTPARIPLG